VDGMSMAEVAECLNITVPTAKARAHRARLLLRQRLGGFMSGRRQASRWPLKVAQALVDAAHQVCPYSHATRGNIDVTLDVV